MEKFETILAKFVKNPYINIQLSKGFLNAFKQSIFIQLLLLPFLIVFLLGMSIWGIYTSLKFDLSTYYSDLVIFNYLYIIILFSSVVYYFILIKDYFHLKYKLSSFKKFFLKYGFYFVILLQLFSLSLLFIIKNIKPTTIYLYYTTAIILFIIYYFYYKKKWLKHIFLDNYSKYKKEILKPNFPEDSLTGKFSLDLKESEKDKPIFTKAWEFIAMIMLRFGFTLPVVAAVSGSGMANYDGMIYFCVYIFLFMIPVFARAISSQVVFYKFIKQIEKEENTTIYNGKLITNDEK